MSDTRKISAKHYYEYLPGERPRCGDIWIQMPSYGVLGLSHVSGLVITPPCDLANRKAETIVYLPILSVSQYFHTTGAYPDIREKTQGLLTAGKLKSAVEWPANRYSLPHPSTLTDASKAISDHLAAKRRGDKEIEALNRAQAGISIIRKMASGESTTDNGELNRLFGPDWTSMKSKLVTNSYSSDLHFLPKDEQTPGFGSLEDHSVVMFRYPLTAPIEVLDLAQTCHEREWAAAMDRLNRTYPCANIFQNKQPLKILSLKNDFLADLLNRYCSVYSRIGSPDFTSSSVQRISKEIDGQ